MKPSALISSVVRCLIIFPIAVAMACSEGDKPGQTGAGTLVPEVLVDPDVEADAAAEVVVTPVPEPGEMSFRLSTADGSYSHTWQRLDEYDPTCPLLPGQYVAEAFIGSQGDEGFEAPSFYGSATCEVADGATARPEIMCRLSNTMLLVRFNESFTEAYPDGSLTFHSSGGGYVTYGIGETRQAYLRPGDIEVSMNITPGDSDPCSFLMTTIRSAKPGYCYTATLSADVSGENPVVTLSFDERTLSDDVRFEITPEFLAGEAPALECHGFVSGETLRLAEGVRPAERVEVAVAQAVALRSLMLTVGAPSLLASGWPAEVDLLNATDAQLEIMRRAGLGFTAGATPAVDFTSLLANLRSESGDNGATFSLRAVSVAGKVSEPAVLGVELGDPEMEIVSVTPATVGVGVAALTFRTSEEFDPQRIEVTMLSADNRWEVAEITSVETLEENGLTAVRFRMPEATDPVNVRLAYCGDVKGTVTVGYISPEFTVEADAFALAAVVRINAADPELLPAITRRLRIYFDGTPAIQLERDEQEGLVVVTGLSPDTRYRLLATVMDHPTDADFMPAVEIVTEKDLPLPNGDFEEIKDDLDWRDMASGGRYSQNIVEIFNRQNFTTFKTSVPDGWANVNAKTFSKAAKNPNTWYMQPSAQTLAVDLAYSGAYAVRIDNVAWDLDGPAIPDYVQTGQPYLPYNPNVPQIAHRSVGKLFLGSYEFNPSTLEEVYKEGIAFTSRPAALNGFYRFIPASGNSSGSGMASIEVIGEVDGRECVIAEGKGRLTPSSGYTAFKVPLSYSMFGVKAKTVRVMLAASAEIGDIASETATTVTVADPVAAKSAGATLWLDALSLSY